MNKLVLSIVLVAVLAIALGTAGFVSAQTPTPQAPAPWAGAGGRGGMAGGRGMGGGMMNNQSGAADLDGPMHDEMIAVFANELGISVDDLNARLTDGETMAQIATSKGLTAAQFSTLMTTARSQGIAQAVKDGSLTQEQADWMNQRGAGMANGGGRGMRGTGQGRNANPDCPYYPQPQQ